jgi:hypothetical protein
MSTLLSYNNITKSDAIFSNFQFEVTLISLATDDYFNWQWIDDTRNRNLSVKTPSDMLLLIGKNGLIKVQKLLAIFS